MYVQYLCINIWLSELCASHTCVAQDVDQQLWLGADSNVKLHLIKLLEEAKVTKTEGEDGLVRWTLAVEPAKL